MNLILMRHAIAEQRSASRYPDDALRPLAKAGQKKHRAVSVALQRMGVDFDEILSSPLVRARQTAEITARVYGWTSEIVETDALGHGYSVEALAGFLNDRDPEATLLCVGHEPDISDFSAHLLHASGDVAIDFKKSGVIGLAVNGEVRPGAATLLYFLKPGHMAQLAGRKA